MVSIDDFCAKHGCTRKELLEMVDNVVANVNTLNKDEIKHKLAEIMAEDMVAKFQMEHLSSD